MRVLVILFLSFVHISAHAENIKIGFIDTELIVVNLSQYKQSVDESSKGLSMPPCKYLF